MICGFVLFWVFGLLTVAGAFAGWQYASVQSAHRYIRDLVLECNLLWPIVVEANCPSDQDGTELRKRIKPTEYSYSVYNLIWYSSKMRKRFGLEQAFLERQKPHGLL